MVPVAVMPWEQLAPCSEAALIRSALMKSSIRPSLALSTLSWKPHAWSEIGLSRPSYGLISIWVLPRTLVANLSTWSLGRSGR